MSAEQTPDIAAVLAEHAKTERVTKPSRRPGIIEWTTRCICGEEMPQQDHRAHVAGALAPVLAAAVREAEQRAWDEGYEAATLMARCWGHTDWWEDEPENPYRADRITEPVSHEAATSGEEASKA